MNGLARWKIEHPEFMRTLENNDLICITETWMNESNCKLITTKCESRFNAYFSRRQKDQKAKRESGGIIVLVKADFGKNITLTLSILTYITIDVILLNPNRCLLFFSGGQMSRGGICPGGLTSVGQTSGEQMTGGGVPGYQDKINSNEGVQRIRI